MVPGSSGATPTRAGPITGLQSRVVVEVGSRTLHDVSSTPRARDVLAALGWVGEHAARQVVAREF